MSAAVIYLASRSPRRRELLAQIGVSHQLLDVDIDERPLADEPVAEYVERLAREKAAAGWCRVQSEGLPPLPVLGADTAISVNGRILGKPADFEEARAMLESLSGRTHQVFTGVALCGDRGVRAAVSRTDVFFRVLTPAEIERYWASGEPRDKAGAYGIQGLAAVFVERIEGSYSGVVGLPLFETARLLGDYAVPCTW